MLYYLVRPGSALVWADVPDLVVDVARQAGADLARLEWNDDTDLVLDDNKIRIALRHGEPCSAGIVVDGLKLRAGGKGDELRSLLIESEHANAALAPQDEAMDRLFPGWKAHGEQLNREVREGIEASARQRDEHAAELLATAPKPRLIEHWRSLGGHVPTPA